nr:unnamed protein product [Spirometra erinaceieuropaei]
MDDERLPKRLFYGDVATGSRRQGGQIRRYKDTLKSSLKRLHINPTDWEELARDRPTWRRTVKTGAAIYEANRIAAAKVKREVRKSQIRPIRNAAAQPLPTCPRCQRTFRARIGLVGHLRTNCTSRTAPAIVPAPASSLSSLPPTNSDTPSAPPLPSSSFSSTAPAVAVQAAVSHIANHNTATATTPTCPHCDRTFTSHNGLVGHLRIHRTETADIDATDLTTPHSPASSSTSSFTATTTATPASVAHDFTTAAPDTTTGTTPATFINRCEGPDYICPHCDRTFTSRIGLVGHLRIHRTESGEPVPGAPTYTHRTRLHCSHCPRTFTHRMGLFGHMRIHERGIDRNSDTATTSNTPRPILAPPSHAPTTTTATTNTSASSTADTDTADLSCPHCPRAFTSRIGLVGHLRIHRTETGEPVPGAPTYTHRTRLHCPHCPRTFTHRMGLFGHMRIHNDLRELSPEEAVVFSADIAFCLSLTPLYKESFFYLDLAVKNGLPLGQFLCILVAAAKYAPYDEVFETIDLFHTHGLQPSDDFYLTFVNRVDFDQSSSAMYCMERLLNKLGVHEWIVSSSVITKIKTFFERRGWTGTLGVKAMGCHVGLEKYRISDSDICSLAEGFFNSVVLGKNSDELYLTTTPEELASLKNFIQGADRKFDCVIDLPNFFHTALSPRKISSLPEETLSNALCSALYRLHEEHHLHHFCLVGKQRGLVNNKKFWKTIRQLGDRTGITVRSFVTSHKSNDDAFMIYLALWSGPSCYIISNDEFRQHRCTLGPKLGEQLSKWQNARQISLHPGQPTSLYKPMECAARVQAPFTPGFVCYRLHLPLRLPLNSLLRVFRLKVTKQRLDS